VYQKLHRLSPDGYTVFPSILGHGTITCTSFFPTGYILVLTRVEGQQLNRVWDMLGPRAKNHVRDQCRKAVEILRHIRIWSPDAGKHNVLYAPETGQVTMLDFEVVGVCSEFAVSILGAPELASIFKRA
jgi:hypothetical protein